MPFVHFFEEGVMFRLPHPRKTARWIKESISRERKKIAELNYIFCSDEYLKEINVHYLNHATYTDILTFDTSEDPSAIQGDIYISIDRIRDNAQRFKVEFDEELHRVIIHGVLHLLGYSDKTTRQKAFMRKKEDAYLSLLK